MKWGPVLTLVWLLLLAGCNAPAPRVEDSVTLTYASPYPPSHPFSRADAAWIRHVEAESDGRLSIRPFWSGSLLSSQESMDELRHGVADIGVISPIYARGGAHVQRAQAGFYAGVRSIEDQVSVYKCLADTFPALNRELHGLHVLAVQGGNLPGVLTRGTPVRSLDDLRGLRLRAPTENLEVLRELGADPVNMPMGEVYSALAKNVIDGVIAPADTMRSLHFAEVARYFTTLQVSRGAYPARAIGLRRWNALPQDLRDILTAAQPVWEAALAEGISASDASGIAYGRQEGIAILAVSPEDQQRFDALYNRNAARIADGLTRYDTDGRAMLQTAQRLISQSPEQHGPDCMQQTRYREDLP
ncbi:TRAP transporter substrate-binding protein DctP [Polymorphobacter sp.]|uniref:TRAP transporter substrate-binding protein DctP n=1 Tax=Polymorphobacter sp. TaxID=1909290 RepID=UPI003F6E5850